MNAPQDPIGRLAGRWRVLGAGIAAQAAMSALQQGLPVLGPALRDAYDLSLPALGALLACVNWGVMLTLIGWGALADRMGERAVVGIGLGASAAALLLAASAETAVALGLALAVAGGFSAAAITASGRAVMGWFGRDQRGLALGLRQMAVPLGAGLASLALPAAALAFGLSGAFGALALAALLGAVIAYAFLRAPPAPSPPRIDGLPKPLKDRALWGVSLASALMFWAQACLSAFFMVLLVEVHGFHTATAALLFGSVHLLGGIARILAGALSDRSGRRLPHLRLHGGALAAALVLCGAAAQTGRLGLAAALTAATVLSYGWNGLAFTAVAEMAGHARAGLALGLHGTVMRVVSAPATFLFGATAARAGWSAAFLSLAALVLVATLLLGRSLAEEERRNAH